MPYVTESMWQNLRPELQWICGKVFEGQYTDVPSQFFCPLGMLAGRQADIHADRQAGRQTYMHAERQAGRQAGRQAYMQACR